MCMLAAMVLAMAACSNNEGEGDGVDKTKLAVQDDARKPFYSRNPVSKSPAYVVEDEERRLEFPGWGSPDPQFTLSFPEAKNYGRVILEYTMGSEGRGPADYDNLVLLYVKNKADGEWYELARVFTPFGGVFDSEWEKRFYLDITEYAPMLSADTEFKYYYQGFDATADKAHTMKIKVLCYNEGEGGILGVERIYDSSLNPNNGYRGWAYGVAGYDIEAEERLGRRTINIPEGTTEVMLRVAITGHGHDMGSFPNRPDYVVLNAAEFDDNYYYIAVDGVKQEASGHIFYSNADNYIQMGTYNYDRANWAPGNPMNVHYWRLAPNAKREMIIDFDLEEFVSTFSEPNAEGVANYVVSVYAFYK